MKKDQELARFLLSSHFNMITFKFMAETTMHGLSVNSSLWTLLYNNKYSF